MWIQSLGGEDPLEQGMATHSSILAWRIPWTEEPGGLTVDGVPKIWIHHGLATITGWLPFTEHLLHTRHQARY